MPVYTAPLAVRIHADNQRDAFDALGAFLDTVSAQAEALGITIVRPTFEELGHES